MAIKNRRRWQIPAVVLLLSLATHCVSAGADDYYSTLAAAGAVDPQVSPGPSLLPPGSAYRPAGSPAWPAGGAMVPQYSYPPPAVSSGGPGDFAAATPAAVSQPILPAVTCAEAAKSNWYGRVDYFTWYENPGDGTHVLESGPMYTLGYERQTGPQRFRFELFGGNVAYDGFDQYVNNNGTITSTPLAATTRYLGGRGEYEYVFQSPGSNMAVFLGVGNRFWIRDLRDAYDQLGNESYGYQETWWTFYPYLGLDLKGALGPRLEWFSSMRVGVTAITINKGSDMDEPLWPKTGITGQLELGLRGETVSLSVYSEVMTWRQSSNVDYLDPVNGPMYADQPNSRMLTVGGRLGFQF